VVDDEEWLWELVETLIRDWFKEVTLLKLRNRDEAWQELLRADPDLLITDMRNDNVPRQTENLGMGGFELLRLLAARRVKYPILAVSGCFSMSGLEGLAKQHAGPNLKVSYLTKPFTSDLFYQALLKCLGPSDNPQRRPSHSP
jgi:CheY-like chemotaxis protein